MEEIRDKRKYVKTAFISKDNKSVLIIRLNQTTKKDYSVCVNFDTWVSFRKDRNLFTLQIAGFDKEQINFLAHNNLKGERKIWPKLDKKKQRKLENYKLK